MKIKTKKRMFPEEYAKYMIDKHGISGLEYELIDDNIIDAPKRYTLTFELNPVSMKEVSDVGFENKEFTVEIEEELTEDTVIQEMLLIYNNGITHLVENKSLNDLIKTNLKSAYTMNDDLRLILIWRDGKLI